MRKVQAGGIIRTSLDNTWRTPESILEPVRAYFGGPIPLDPASAPDNPTKALRYCCGPPGSMFSGAELADGSDAERRDLERAVEAEPDDLRARARLDGFLTRGLPFPPAPEVAVEGERFAVNGLELGWDWPFFCNPPYGESMREWIQKTAAEAVRLPTRAGITLWPASRWETSYLPPALERARVLCLHRGRVAFVSSADGAAVSGNPGASMLVGWNVDLDRFARAIGVLGACFEIRAVSVGGVA